MTIVTIILAATLCHLHIGIESAQAEGRPAATTEGRTHWYLIYLQGKRVGHTHGTEKAIVHNGQPRSRIDAQMVMKMARFGTTVETKMDIRSIEDADGNLDSFKTSMTAGAATMTSQGVVKNDKLEMQLSTLGQKTNETIDWTGDTMGFFGREYSLEDKPMKPGEERTIKVLVPMSTSIADVRLKAVGYETTDLLTGRRKLLKIDSLTTTVAAGQKVKMQETLYADSTGLLIKSVMPAMQQVLYRTTKEVALGKFDAQEVDLGKLSIVKADAPTDLLSRESARYRVAFRVGDPSETILSSGPQSAKKIDNKTIELTVTPSTSAATKNDQPNQEHRLANGMIQSGDARIKAMAAQIAPGEKDPVRLAVAIEKYVFDFIDEKNFSQVFASAAEVAEQKTGDCTEHGVLLAALARARDLPSRVVMGLVYVDRFGGFGYHMWSEVWVGDRWLALDGTLGRGGITAGHIKIAHSSLKGAGPLASMLPVINVMGNVTIKVLP